MRASGFLNKRALLCACFELALALFIFSALVFMVGRNWMGTSFVYQGF